MRRALPVWPRLAVLVALGCAVLGFGGSASGAAADVEDVHPYSGPIIVSPTMHSCDVKHHTMGAFHGAG